MSVFGVKWIFELHVLPWSEMYSRGVLEMDYPRPVPELAFPPWCILHHHPSIPHPFLELSQQTIPLCFSAQLKTPMRELDK